MSDDNADIVNVATKEPLRIIYELLASELSLTVNQIMIGWHKWDIPKTGIYTKGAAYYRRHLHVH